MRLALREVSEMASRVHREETWTQWLKHAVTALLLCPLLVGGTSPQSRAETAALPQCPGMWVAAGGADQCIHPKTSFSDCAGCPELIVLPPGSFLMGSPDEEAGHTSAEGPLHRVDIALPFAVSKYETTFSEWDACVAEGGCSHSPRDAGWGRGQRPVINVSFEDIESQYLPWLSRKSGRVYRLLTEAEWEYAARAGGQGPFATGMSISTNEANFDGTTAFGATRKGAYRKQTMHVGSFAPNGFGLHDLHGNVWEWVQDCYVASYEHVPADGSPAASSSGCQRVMRGGSWIDSARVVRSAARGHVPANTRFIYRGFRVARSP